MSSTLSFDAVANAYDDFMGRWTRVYIPALLSAAKLAPGQRVLDVATGTGESAVMAAAAVAPAGRVVGVDVSLPMLRGARAKLDGRPIQLLAMDGQALAFEDEAFDAVICQLGLMFFPDPLAGLRECRRVLRPGGRVAALVWSTADRVPWFGVLGEEAVRHLPARRAEVFQGVCLGEADRLARLLDEAGFRDVTLVTETQRFVFDSFDAYWGHVESGAMRVGLMLRDLSDDARGAARDSVRRRMAAFETGGRLELPTEARLASGRK